MIEVYRCEFCGVEFTDKIKCCDHEDQHMQPNQVLAAPLSYIPQTAPYPSALKVQFPDGTSVAYEYAYILFPAEKR